MNPGTAIPASTGEIAERIPERLGEFELLDKLGGGGMGVVFRARQSSLGRIVALKLVRPELLWFEGARERFLREAEAIAQLQHPGIVQVYTAGEAQGVPYLAMELVQGTTLADALGNLAARPPATLHGIDLARAAGVATPSGRFAGGLVTVAARIALVVAEALAHAHSHAILHRDVKPSNVMLAHDGRVLLFDFGLASSRAEQEPTQRLTRSNSQLGSLGYAAPEQTLGEQSSADARADVFSLGCVLYELLTLRPAFLDATPQRTLDKLLREEPAPVAALNPRVPQDLRAILGRALEKEPSRRYASMRAFADDLAAFLEHRPVSARLPSPLGRLARWARRDKKRAALVAAAPLLVLLVLLGGYVLVTRETTSRGRAAEREAVRERALERGFFELARGSRERARAELATALTIDPADPEAQLGMALLEGRGVESRPAGASPRSPSESFVAGVTALAGSRRGDRVGLARGRDELVEAIEHSKVQRPIYHMWRVEAAARGGDPKEIARVTESLLSLWPEHALASCWAGSACLDSDPARARALLDKALALDGTLGSAWADLAVHALGRGAVDEAEAACTKALALEPENVEALINHAVCRLQKGDRATARAELAHAVQLAPEKPGVHFHTARLLLAEGDRAGAIAEYERTVALAPDYVHAWQNLAVLHQEAGLASAEVETLERALAQNALWADGWQMLSHALRRAGRDRAAVAPLRRYVELCPQDAEMKRYLGELEAVARKR